LPENITLAAGQVAFMQGDGLQTYSLFSERLDLGSASCTHSRLTTGAIAIAVTKIALLVRRRNKKRVSWPSPVFRPARGVGGVNKVLLIKKTLLTAGLRLDEREYIGLG
jgi:hypothetical protein